MTYKMTAVYANDKEHMDILKAMLKTDFGKAIKVIEMFDNEPVLDDGGKVQRYLNNLETEPMSWKQKRALRKAGFEVHDMIVHHNSVTS